MFPPKINVAVFGPVAPGIVLAVLISVVSVHEVPSQISTTSWKLGPPGPGAPPAAIAAVCVPAPPIQILPSFKLLTSVHEDPSHDSVAT